MARDIDAVNDAMVAAGIRVFVGGLKSIREARSVILGADDEFIITDGPYLETKEHIGGFWVLELPNMEEATEWGRKAAKACRAPVEVRPFH
nr:YciI family protein [Kordiimonas gwangyangensis]